MADLDPALDGLQPTEVWRQFEAISRIPRPSLHEEGVRRHLRALAAAHGWSVRQDAAGNLVLCVPGRGRGLHSAPVALQGHMDMVCEKEFGVEHDFLVDPIRLRRTTMSIAGDQREVLQAVGTTLGSDNGLGCAAAVALALDPALDHPPLELLFTADEEQGMSGALQLDPSLLRARRLINFDAELEGRIYLSCAGGRELHAQWHLDREPVCSDDVALRIEVDGLRGGHSGVEIHEGRANAIAVLIRLLTDRRLDLEGVRLGSCEGGTRANAIARRAAALLWVARTRVDELRRGLDRAAQEVRDGFGSLEPDLHVSTGEVTGTDLPMPISAGTTRAIFEAMRHQPHGVITWSTLIPGLVETSNNLAVVSTTQDELSLVAMARSSRSGAIETLQDRCGRTLEASGASLSLHNWFPGWEPKPDTELVAHARSAYRDLFGREVIIEAIHAGLECGILGDRIPGIEMIAFGPDIHGAHTPAESLVIDSVEPFFRFAAALLTRLC